MIELLRALWKRRVSLWRYRRAWALIPLLVWVGVVYVQLWPRVRGLWSPLEAFETLVGDNPIAAHVLLSLGSVAGVAFAAGGLTPISRLWTGILRLSSAPVSEEEVQDDLRAFGRDATSLMVFGGDGSFLNDDKEQLKEIVNLGGRARILVDRVRMRIAPAHMRTLKQAGVEVRAIRRGDENSLRGRIKKAEHGGLAARLYFKVEDGYDKEEPKIIMLREFLLDFFDSQFEKSTDASVRCVIFDMDGVAFTKPQSLVLASFEEEVNMEIGVPETRLWTSLRSIRWDYVGWAKRLSIV